MTHSNSFQEACSGLEVENSAEAPERDWHVDAPEPDHIASQPQVVPGTGLEICYDPTLPETVNDVGKEVHISENPSISKGHGISKIKSWVYIVAALISVVVVALGVGIGLGRRHRSKRLLGKTISPAPTISPVPSPLALPEKHTIVNDTSFAAVTTSDENKHVFFQDSSSDIREMIYIVTESKWSAGVEYIIATDAKKLSPMSAFQVPSDISHWGGEEIHFFYILQNNHIGARTFDLGSASWYNANETGYYGNINDIEVAADSRALSATLSRNDTLNTINNITSKCDNGNCKFTSYLLYEDVNEDATWLIGSFVDPDVFTSVNVSQISWHWRDLKISERINDGPLFAPLSSGLGLGPSANSSDFSIKLSLTSWSLGNNGSIITDINIVFHIYEYEDGETTRLPVSGDFFNNTDINHMDFTEGCITNGSSSDCQEYTFVVANSTLKSIYGRFIGDDPGTFPESPFPFARLGNTSPVGDGALYLYHQINETVIAEDIYQRAAGYWTSSNISVQISD